ncbi:MAG: hypothetical protein ACO1O3_00695 [Sphingobium sp.]
MTIAGATSAHAAFVHAVHTDCPAPGTPVLHPLPGKDAEVAGRRYAPISDEALARARTIAEGLLGPVQGDIGQVNAVYYHGTIASGEQWRDMGTWPVNDLRALARDCTVSPARSLGRRGDETFAFVDVACASAQDPWASLRVGVAMKGAALSTLCLNVGEPAVLQLGKPEARKPEG